MCLEVLLTPGTYLANLHPFEIVGVLGFFLYVTSYTLIACRILNPDTKRFFAMNGCAATMVLIGLMVSFNLAAAMIQVFWIILSIIGVLVRVRRVAL